MILAAGLGTRLAPLTDSLPKALVPVGGVPILERVARRLIAAGADHLVINTHHFADRIVEFVRDRGGFGVDVTFSHEPERPLETGGGLLHAARVFRSKRPFFLHNVDVLSEVPLEQVYQAHMAASPLATLVVGRRESSRYLLFDRLGLLGRVDEGKGLDVRTRQATGTVDRLAFAGIHVISPAIFDLFTEKGAFSILDPYLRLAGAGHPILPFDAGGFPWMDIGKPERLAEANARFGGTVDRVPGGGSVHDPAE